MNFLASFAGVPFLLDTGKHVPMPSDTPAILKQQPFADVVDEVYAKLPPHWLQEYAHPSAFQGRNLAGIAAVYHQATQRPAPDVLLNTFYYPHGAARWAIWRGLMTSSMVAAVIGKTGPQPFVLQSVPDSPNANAINFGGFTTSMYLLPPRTLGEHAGSMDGLYLVTLVDERYWWQFFPVLLHVNSQTQWQTLISQIASALNITLAAPSVPAVYSQPEADSSMWSNMEPASVLLDAIAFNIGCHVVRGLDGTYTLQRPIDSQNAYISNIGRMQQVVRIAGGAFFDGPSTGVTKLPVKDLAPSRNLVIPNVVQVSFPKYIQGNDPVPHFVNPRYANPRPSAWIEDSFGDAWSINVPLVSGNLFYASGGVLSSGALGSGIGAAVAVPSGYTLKAPTGINATYTIHTTAKAVYSGEISISQSPLNASGLTSLAVQLATDYWNGQAVLSEDESYPGIFAWTPEGIHDIVWTYSARQGQASTRVMRSPWNESVREMQHATIPVAGNAVNPKGVGGPSVAHTLRDTTSGTLTTFLSQTFASGDQQATFADVNLFPTQNRWRSQIDSEVIMFNGTSGGTTVTVAYRAVDGTLQATHNNGASVSQVLPNTNYGTNLVTWEKGQHVYPSDWTSGGIQGANVVPQIQTIQLLAGSGITVNSGTFVGQVITSGAFSGQITSGQIINSVTMYSGQLQLFNSASGSWDAREPVWLFERNGYSLVSGRRYDGHFQGYGFSGVPAPIYATTDLVGNVGASGTSGGGSLLHNLLSPTHPDTVPFSPPRQGDLPVGTLQFPSPTAGLWQRLPVGTSGEVLIADPLHPAGMRWDFPQSGGGTFHHNFLSETHPDTVPYSPPKVGDLPVGTQQAGAFQYAAQPFDNTTTTYSVTLDEAPTAGRSLVIVILAKDAGPNPSFTITDNQNVGNDYALIADAANNNGPHSIFSAIYQLQTVTDHPVAIPIPFTITVTPPVGTNPEMVIVPMDGIGLLSVDDPAATVGDGTLPSLILQCNNQADFVVLAMVDSDLNAQITPPQNSTLALVNDLFTEPNGDQFVAGEVATGTIINQGSVDFQWLVNPVPTHWAACGVAFKMEPGGQNALWEHFPDSTHKGWFLRSDPSLRQGMKWEPGLSLGSVSIGITTSNQSYNPTQSVDEVIINKYNLYNQGFLIVQKFLALNWSIPNPTTIINGGNINIGQTSKLFLNPQGQPSKSITNMTPCVDGQLLFVLNDGAFPITFANEAGGNCYFITPSGWDLVLYPRNERCWQCFRGAWYLVGPDIFVPITNSPLPTTGIVPAPFKDTILRFLSSIPTDPSNPTTMWRETPCCPDRVISVKQYVRTGQCIPNPNTGESNLYLYLEQEVLKYQNCCVVSEITTLQAILAGCCTCTQTPCDYHCIQCLNGDGSNNGAPKCLQYTIQNGKCQIPPDACPAITPSCCYTVGVSLSFAQNGIILGNVVLQDTTTNQQATASGTGAVSVGGMPGGATPCTPVNIFPNPTFFNTTQSFNASWTVNADVSSFAFAQIVNFGTVSLTITVGANTYTVQPGQQLEIPIPGTSALNSNGGNQAFTVTCGTGANVPQNYRDLGQFTDATCGGGCGLVACPVFCVLCLPGGDGINNATCNYNVRCQAKFTVAQAGTDGCLTVTAPNALLTPQQCGPAPGPLMASGSNNTSAVWNAAVTPQTGGTITGCSIDWTVSNNGNNPITVTLNGVTSTVPVGGSSEFPDSSGTCSSDLNVTCQSTAPPSAPSAAPKCQQFVMVNGECVIPPGMCPIPGPSGYKIIGQSFTSMGSCTCNPCGYACVQCYDPTTGSALGAPQCVPLTPDGTGGVCVVPNGTCPTPYWTVLGVYPDQVTCQQACSPPVCQFWCVTQTGGDWWCAKGELDSAAPFTCVQFPKGPPPGWTVKPGTGPNSLAGCQAVCGGSPVQPTCVSAVKVAAAMVSSLTARGITANAGDLIQCDDSGNETAIVIPQANIVSGPYATASACQSACAGGGGCATTCCPNGLPKSLNLNVNTPQGCAAPWANAALPNAFCGSVWSGFDSKNNFWVFECLNNVWTLTVNGSQTWTLQSVDCNAPKFVFTGVCGGAMGQLVWTFTVT